MQQLELKNMYVYRSGLGESEYGSEAGGKSELKMNAQTEILNEVEKINGEEFNFSTQNNRARAPRISVTLMFF